MSAAQNDTLNHASRRDVLKAAAGTDGRVLAAARRGRDADGSRWRGGFGAGTERIRAHRR